MNKQYRNRLMNFLKKITPFVVVKVYRKIYDVLSITRSFWLPVHKYSGLTNICGDLFIFSYLGWDQRISSYWLNKIFSQYDVIRDKKYIPLWKVKKYLQEHAKESNLILIELTNKFTDQQISEEPGFILPRWIRMYLHADLSLSLLEKHQSVRRIIRKNSFELEKGYSRDDFIFFYERMYRPYVDKRHKDSAIIENSKMMLKEFEKKQSKIYFVIKDGQRLAGIYEQNDTDIPFIYALGLLNGSDDLLRIGIVSVLYYFVLSDHLDNNRRQINMGGTSPLLKDGLTFYKLMLGAKVADIKKQGSQRLKLIPSKNSSAVNCFLRSNPFIYIENESIYCAVFKDDNHAGSDEEFQKQISQAKKTGVKETRVFRLNSQNWLEHDPSAMGEGAKINRT